MAKSLEFWTEYHLQHIRIRKFNQNLKTVAPFTLAKNWEISIASKIKSWKCKTILLKKSQQNCWPVDFLADVHICNNRLLMIEYQEYFIKVERSKLDRIWFWIGKIYFRLRLERNSICFIFKFWNVHYFSNSLLNLVNLVLLHRRSIYPNNKHSFLYNVKSIKILVLA